MPDDLDDADRDVRERFASIDDSLRRALETDWQRVQWGWRRVEWDWRRSRGGLEQRAQSILDLAQRHVDEAAGRIEEIRGQAPSRTGQARAAEGGPPPPAPGPPQSLWERLEDGDTDVPAPTASKPPEGFTAERAATDGGGSTRLWLSAAVSVALLGAILALGLLIR